MSLLIVLHHDTQHHKHLLATFAAHFPRQNITATTIECIRAQGGEYFVQALIDAIVSPEDLCEEIRALCADTIDVIGYPRTVPIRSRP